MANVGVSSIRLMDSDGDALDDGAGKLNVSLGDASGNTVDISQASTAANPDLDNTYLLGTHALVSGRSNASTTTLGIAAKQGTYNSLCVAISDGGTIADVSAAGHLEVSLEASGLLSIDSDDYLQVVDMQTHHTSITSIANLSVSDTTAEQINGDSTSIACKHIDVAAGIANKGIIWIGGEDVDENLGIPLYAGDVYSIDISNANQIYVLASVDGEDIYWNYYN